MPFVNIRIVREVIAADPEGIKSKVSTAVTSAIADAAEIPEDNVWVVFEEVSETDWFAGGTRVKELRSGS
ncbi:tautomerase family protein [Hoeflea prorocentri]|uniref:Tautomerase family protein n=1 Tax=Hoeflea prorocentri TaxID=1922333 RepID=A0A9X3ZKB1_9HYPH|nr:tautomerase family protein [Hoeflea prorocentri]MCY6383715.1 tautomerase family protein [Hoeflea prorocentri]MDA5401515.1 tautomerase family protein [Hoeflea prorocentri]